MDTVVPPALASALSDRYRIDRAIGQGGMATVYGAFDVRHDRTVAIKVLRPELAAVIGAARFLTEIKTTANLQHPHILPLFDSGEVDGTVFYVMPYVEGESLRARLQREHQLPIDEAVQLAVEVAGALDYAHRHGVVHRDIKPENILLHDGQALIADFGIALAVSRSEGGTRMTETGMSLGTPHYMAPEQAMGEREITARADIYALGAVLYEMLMGEPPFTGATAQAVVARAITERPRAMRTQRATIPAHVESAVLQALEKLPADRFGTASEFTAALRDPSRTQARIAERAVASGGAPSWRARAFAPVAALLAVALVGLAWVGTRPRAETPVTRYLLTPGPGVVEVEDRGIAVSPDGTRIGVIAIAQGRPRRIYVKERGDALPRPVEGTEGVSQFTFSPDGQEVAFTAVAGLTYLRVVRLSGGTPRELSDSVDALHGLAWAPSGEIVTTQRAGRRLVAFNTQSGGRRVIYEQPPDSNARVAFPRIVPDADAVLVSRYRSSGFFEIASIPLAGGAPRTFTTEAVFALPLIGGDVALLQASGRLSVRSYDARSLVLEGPEVFVADSIAVTDNGIPVMDVSHTGVLVARRGAVSTIRQRHQFVWFDRSGRTTVVDTSHSFSLTSFGSNRGWAISPDGRRVVYGANSEFGDNLWVKDLPDGPAVRITFDSFPSYRPRWSRDGRSILYLSRRFGEESMLFRRNADGTGTERLVLAAKQPPGIFEAELAPDESTIVFRKGGTVTVIGGRDLFITRLGGDTTLRPLVASAQFDEASIALSPDGRWLLYESNESGRVETYARPFPNVDDSRLQISLDGGRAPMWRRDGREIFYVNARRELVSVPVTVSGGRLQLGQRRTLFLLAPDVYLAAAENYRPFDIAPDGSRFLMARRLPDQQSQVVPTEVTEHWFAEIRARRAQR